MEDDWNPFDTFNDNESENVHLWLHQWQHKKQLQRWSDAEAVQHASLCLGQLPYTWFAAQGQHLQSWDQFSAAMLQRFAENEQALALKLRCRRQQQHKSVQAYADALTMLFDQTSTPTMSQCNMFLEGLKPSLKERVVNTCPETLRTAIKHAK